MFVLVISLLLLLGGYIAFYFKTKRREFILVVKKFKINIGGHTILKIQDNKNNEYVISDVFVSEKKAQELWEKIKEDQLNYITFYGINIDFLDYKYNIIDVQ